MAVGPIEGFGDVEAMDVWGRRVLRCSAVWGALGFAAIGFDMVMDGLGWAATAFHPTTASEHSWPSVSDVAAAAIVIVIFSLVMGAVVGSILPARIDPSDPRPLMPEPDELIMSPMNLISHMIRRAAAAAPFVASFTCAVLAGLVSVTTDVGGDDSPSTLGAAGGLYYGAIVGLVLASIFGALVGLVAAVVVEREVSHLSGTGLIAVVAIATAAIPLNVLFDLVPIVAPRAVLTTTTVSCVAALIVVSDWLIRWWFVPTASTDA